MSRFSYTARGPNGQVQGSLEAMSAAAVAGDLRAKPVFASRDELGGSLLPGITQTLLPFEAGDRRLIQITHHFTQMPFTGAPLEHRPAGLSGTGRQLGDLLPFAAADVRCQPELPAGRLADREHGGCRLRAELAAERVAEADAAVRAFNRPAQA